MVFFSSVRPGVKPEPEINKNGKAIGGIDGVALVQTRSKKSTKARGKKSTKARGKKSTPLKKSDVSQPVPRLSNYAPPNNSDDKLVRSV